MKKKLYLISMALMALVSCNKDEIVQINNGNKIVFRTAVDTRATELTAESLNRFYVTALTQSGENYFTDVLFEREGNSDTFISDVDYYWPAEGSLEFYAYAPDTQTLGAEITINNQTKTMADYEVNSDIANQIDFVTAHATGNKAENISGIALEFKHQLSQIEINGLNTNRGYVIKVKGIRIKNVTNTGSFSFLLEQWTPDYEALTDYEITFEEITLGNNTTTLMIDKGNAMLVPQNRPQWAPAGNNATIADEGEGEAIVTDPKGSYLGFLIQVETKDGARVFPTDEGTDFDWVAQPLAIEWVGGYKYTYNCDFSYGAGVDPEDGEPVYGSKIDITVNFSNLSWGNNSWQTIAPNQPQQ